MAATRVQIGSVSDQAREILLTPAIDRARYIHNIGGVEQRAEQSRPQSFKGLVSRLEGHGVVCTSAAEGYRAVADLLHAAGTERSGRSNQEGIAVEGILSVMDHAIHSLAQKYGPQPNSLQRNRTEIVDFISAIHDAGLLSTDKPTFERMVSRIASPEGLSAVRDAALFEAARAMRTSLSEQGLAFTQPFLAQLDALELGFRRSASTLARELLGSRLDGSDLLINISSRTAAEGSPRAQFRLESFQADTPQNAALIYKLARLSIQEPPTPDLTRSALFNVLAALGTLEQLSDCVVKDSALIAPAGKVPLCLDNVAFSGATVSLAGPVILKSVQFMDCRVLFKGARGSQLQNVSSDANCTFLGDLSASRIENGCKLCGKAQTLDLRGCTWEAGGTESGNARFRGLFFHTSLVDQAFYDIVKKYRIVPPDEMTVINKQMNSNFGTERMRAAFQHAGLRVHPIGKVPAAAMLPPGVAEPEARVTVVEPRDQRIAITIVTPSTETGPIPPYFMSGLFQGHGGNNNFNAQQTPLRCGSVAEVFLRALDGLPSRSSLSAAPDDRFTIRGPNTVVWPPPEPPRPPPPEPRNFPPPPSRTSSTDEEDELEKKLAARRREQERLEASIEEARRKSEKEREEEERLRHGGVSQVVSDSDEEISPPRAEEFREPQRERAPVLRLGRKRPRS